jgi:DNA-binding transcriptional LysR family regulator
MPRRQIGLKAPLEFKNTEAIKHAVIAGMGISFVTANTFEPEVCAGMLSALDVAGFAWACQWHFVHRTDSNSSQPRRRSDSSCSRTAQRESPD